MFVFLRLLNSFHFCSLKLGIQNVEIQNTTLFRITNKDGSVYNNNQNEFDINALHKLCYVKDH